MYVEKLVAEVLDVPVLAVALSTVVPDDEARRPSSACARRAPIVGRTVHRVVRRLLATAVRAGRSPTTRPSPATALAPIPPDGVPAVPMASARRVFLNGSPGLEFPGYRPPTNAEFVGALVPARAAVESRSPAAAGGARARRAGGRRLPGDGRQRRPEQAASRPPWRPSRTGRTSSSPPRAASRPRSCGRASARRTS